MVIYGLFDVTYDYYEWKTLVAVSQDQEALVKLYLNEADTKHSPLKFYPGDTPHFWDDNGRVLKGHYHHVIQPVKVVY